MAAPKRTLSNEGAYLEIEHRFGANENYGDLTLDASDGGDTFDLYLSRAMGRDNDNRDYSHYAEIELNEEEATELLFRLTLWLESRNA